MKDAFRPSQEDQVVIVHIIWGLNEQDRSSCHHTDYKCKGKTVFDRSFDMNPPPCQNVMLVSINTNTLQFKRKLQKTALFIARTK